MAPKINGKSTVKNAVSLAAVTAVPLALTTLIIYKFGSGDYYQTLLNKPIWFPPLWLIHLASVASTLLLSSAAWLISIGGGFDSRSDALALYISQAVLSIDWDPVVLVMRSARVRVVHFGTLAACRRKIREFSPLAKDLVTPCLGWIGFLTFITCNLIDFWIQIL